MRIPGSTIYNTFRTRVFLMFVLGIMLPWLFFGIYTLLYADIGTIRPNADGTVTSTAVTCGGGGRYDCINEVVSTSSTPGTGSDYVEFVLDNIDNYQMETVSDVSSVSQVQVHLYHNETSANLGYTVSLWNAAESTQYGTTQSITNRSSSQWDTATFSGLSLSQSQLDDLRVRLHCTRLSGGAPGRCRTYALYSTFTYAKLIEMTVGQTGTQKNLNIGTTTAHIGGSFSIVENVSSRNVTSITVTENGTVDAQNHLDNIQLRYDLDTVAPFNCAGESYNGTEAQFGSTDTDGFSGANGTSVFTGSVGISTTSAMCVYVITDVTSGATAAQTIEVEITDPSTQVVGSGSADVTPATVVALSGTTVLVAPLLDQIRYHWRNDNGSESAATSATGGTPDTPNSALGKLTPTRLRLEVSNEGNASSAATQYRIEYAQKITTCDVASGWTDVGAGGGDWDMYNSSHVTDGTNTTDIATGIGGVANENTTFLTPNAAVKDTSSQTANITLTSTQFVELEYSMQATSNATEGYTYCFRVTNAGTVLDTYTRYPEATILADVTVGSGGTQKTTIDIGTSNVNVGGYFSIVDNILGSTSVTSITITASGTVDYQNKLGNIKLLYDLDTVAPYNCVDETYSGSEAQFGATDTDGFNGSGKSTFTGSVDVNTNRTMCIYVVFDANSTIINDKTLDIKIDNASTEVVIGSGTVAPVALVSLSGVTTFVLRNASQVHYHWRNDNGNETGATSATGGTEDTILENLRQTSPRRLRVGVANQGSSTTPPYAYRLEYSLRTTSCALSAGWTDVGTAGGAFDMFNSSNITDGSNTTNISVGTGGVTGVGTTYLASNGAVKDTSSQTANITLPGKNYVDLEYSIVATASSTEGANYCFRVTNAGTPIDTYTIYPRVSIKAKTDFYIQRGVTTISGTSATLTAGTQYETPLAASRAFIRITNTNNTGAGSVSNTGNADDTTVYVSIPSSITSSVVLTRPAAATGDTEVAWEIIEYIGGAGGNNEIIVREQSALTYGSGNTTVNTSAVSGIVDDNDVAVFITGQANPDTNKGYPLGLSTAAWNAGSDTATFTRGASGNAAIVSYAVVEFTGNNWQVQRSSHTYSAAGTTETEAITAVNSLSKTFLHAQKRVGSGLNNHADFGHRVWLSSIGLVSYELESGASTPASHTSVAWVIENTQTVGDTMIVTRSNATQSGGSSPTAVNANITATISGTEDASLFFNNSGNEAGSGGGQNSFPEPMMRGRIISTTQYELWIATPDNDSRTWRAEVVEWPTASRDYAQNYYRFYVNNNLLDPTDPWPAGATDLGENTEVTVNDSPLAAGESARLRMTVQVSSARAEADIDSFTLQYGERVSTCSAISEINWHDLAPSSSTTALWTGTSTVLTDGTALSGDPPSGGALNISVSDVAGTLEEENPSAVTPFPADPGEDIEFDWVIKNNAAVEKTSYCFRMTEADGNLLETYNFYPTMRTAGFTPTLDRWRFYDDETSVTPTVALATENTAPVDVEFDNMFKLRTTIKESTGGSGRDAKFKLQYSEYSDFSQAVFDVASSSTCTASSTWCYADGYGTDNGIIDASVLSGAGTCSGGVGNGCGTHNESISTTTATFDHPPYASTEYEFSLVHAGARANAVYYFRIFDVVNNAIVPASTTYPSLVTEGASLVYTTMSVTAGTVTEGITADVNTTPSTIPFGSVPFDTDYEAVHRFVVDTNATEGYQILMFTRDDLINSYGEIIPNINATNPAPSSWNSACDTENSGCFGYHSGDDILGSGSTRFAPNDSYARFSSTTPQEVFYSPVPVNETFDMVYRIRVNEAQQAGDYQTSVVYLAMPIF